VELLKKHPELTAIVGVNDNLSLGALRGARKSGRSVPRDLSVLAVGDLNAFEVSEPPMTAINQPHEAMGFEAARRLVELLDEPGLLPVKRMQLQPQLVERASVSTIPV
jgi:DNA-binding LacI/PurR family transcriptional regulator